MPIGAPLTFPLILKPKFWTQFYISCTKAYRGGIGNGFQAIYFWD